MVTCKQSTEWVIKNEHGELSVEEKMQLQYHLDDCPYCRIFADQSEIINQAFKKSAEMRDVVLTEEERKELIRAIEIKIGNS